MSALSVQSLSRVFGAVRAIDNVSLTAREGEMLVLVGPSGCGKTTCLRCIAGLDRPDAGRITIGERVVTDTESGILLPPEKREIGMVFQSYAIWPHMTVFENVAYPLRALGMKRSEIIEQVTSTLAVVQLDHLADRYSSQISGGQQQRVALARSLAARPGLLLFDEPLSNLDANLRVQMRSEIRELQNRFGFTAVYVTHDQTEAMAIADRVAVMEGGVLRQIGSPRELYDQPTTKFVANFMGTTNLLGGTVAGDPCNGLIEVELAGELRAHAVGIGLLEKRQAIHLSVRPEAISLSSQVRKPGEPVNFQTNSWPGTIERAIYVGSSFIYRVAVGPHRLEVSARPKEQYCAGDQVYLTVAADDCQILSQ